MFSASVYVCMFGVSYVFYAVCGVYVCMRCVCVCVRSVRFGSVRLGIGVLLFPFLCFPFFFFLRVNFTPSQQQNNETIVEPLYTYIDVYMSIFIYIIFIIQLVSVILSLSLFVLLSSPFNIRLGNKKALESEGMKSKSKKDSNTEQIIRRNQSLVSFPKVSLRESGMIGMNEEENKKNNK